MPQTARSAWNFLHTFLQSSARRNLAGGPAKLRANRVPERDDMRLYLSGAMSGLPESNYPAFNTEAARLRALGYDVANPAENARQESWEAYMRVAVVQMLACDLVAMLPGWKASRGATIERRLALELGMPVFNANELQIARLAA